MLLDYSARFAHLWSEELDVDMRSVISLLVAVLVGYSLSIGINSTISAATLVGFGIEVSLSDRLDMIAKEWVGLGTIYLPLYLVLHAVCFWLLGRVLRGAVLTTVVARASYAGIGAMSLMAFYLSFDAVMGSGGVVVASTRTTAGLLANGATGAVSGFLFQWLSTAPGQTH
ncbi:MAG: hypothetical protein CNE43_02875 [Halieaceae bacterium MED-G26]|nr:MAG: hypothetical protein CNE43_02875 [Halieaceae bacterium MED-G26]